MKSDNLLCRSISALATVLFSSPALLLSTPAWALPSDSGSSGADAALFPVPDALRPAIRFWRDLFTKHASDRVIVHDREQLDLVWHVIELPKNDDGTVDEPAADKVVKAVVDDTRRRLKSLAEGNEPADEDDRVLLTLAGYDRARLQGAWQRLRTQRGVADHFREGLERSREWLEPVQELLAAEGIPTEMVALSFVESMFNPRARSYAGAVGIWQLMPATARDYGLKVTRGHDERADILKATRAAARLLHQNYRMLGSWPLALTGYNWGAFGLKRLCERAGTTDLVRLIGDDGDGALGFAARNFYAEFLAVLEVLAEASAATGVSSIRD
jgi:membrane-bound lytic murein transglycosylase D